MQKVIIGQDAQVLGTVGVKANGSWQLEPRGAHEAELTSTVQTLYAYYHQRDPLLKPATFIVTTQV